MSDIEVASEEVDIVEANELFFDGSNALSWLAHFIWSSFIILVGVGATVTFTSTPYSAQTDVITRFYNKFNPCIFFDHYPASLYTLFGLNLMDIAGTLWSILLLTSIAARTDVFTTLAYSVPLFVHMLTQLAFGNVFVTDMYEHGYTTAPNANASAALIAANATYLQTKNFSAHQREMVEVHSLFYVVWLLGESMLMVMLCFIVAPRGTGSWKFFDGRLDISALLWRTFIVITFFGASTTAIQMLITFFQYNSLAPASLSRIAYDEKTWVQRFFFAINQALQQEVWHPFPVLFFRLVVPLDFGFMLTLSTRKPSAEEKAADAMAGKLRAVFRPERFVGAAFGLLSIATFGTYVFQDPTIAPSDIIFPMATGFRSRPYSYIFVPLFTLCNVLIILGVVLSWYRERLTNQGPTINLAAGVLWILIMVACTSIVLPQFDQTGLLFIGTFLMIPAYMFVTYTPVEKIWSLGISNFAPRAWKQLIWCVLWGGCAAASPFSAVPAGIMMLLLLTVSYFSEEEEHLPLYVCLSASGASYFDENE